jgi:hypothetical protein
MGSEGMVRVQTQGVRDGLGSGAGFLPGYSGFDPRPLQTPRPRKDTGGANAPPGVSIIYRCIAIYRHGRWGSMMQQ